MQTHFIIIDCFKLQTKQKQKKWEGEEEDNKSW